MEYDIGTIFRKMQDKTLEVGFRVNSDNFHCEASAGGTVKFGWDSGYGNYTIQMATELDIPECEGRPGNYLYLAETVRDAVSGRSVERKYKVVFEAKFQLDPNYDFEVVQFNRIPEKSETEKKFVFELYNEGIMHLTGEGFPRDKDKGFELLQRAADNGHPGAKNIVESAASVTEDPDQLKELAIRMFYMQRCKKFEYWASNGNAWAQFKLGCMYFFGDLDKDAAKAAEWWRKSAEQGYSNAQCNLGVLYKKGEGVEQDYAKAMEWYRKASDQGYGMATSNIGVMYCDGIGVPQDREKAIEYFTKAVEQGYQKAKDNLKDMGVEYKPKPKEEPRPSSSSSSSDTGRSTSGKKSHLVRNIIIAVVVIFVLSKAVPFVMKLFENITASVSQTAGTTATVTADSLNMRSAPSTSGDIVKTLKKGDTLTVTGNTENGWVPVNHSGDTGWISADLINLADG